VSRKHYYKIRWKRIIFAFASHPVASFFRSHETVSTFFVIRQHQVPLTTAVTTTAHRDFNFASTQYNAGRIAGVAENNRDYLRRTQPSSPMTITIMPVPAHTTKYNLIICPARRFALRRVMRNCIQRMVHVGCIFITAAYAFIVARLVSPYHRLR